MVRSKKSAMRGKAQKGVSGLHQPDSSQLEPSKGMRKASESAAVAPSRAQIQVESSQTPHGVEDDDSDDEIDGLDTKHFLNDEPLDLNATAEALMAQHREDSMSPFVENALDLLIWSIPFSALFVLLDIMIQQQYAMHPTFLIECGRMLGTLPFLVALIWFTSIKPFAHSRALQYLFFSASLLCGCSFIWTFHEAPFLQVIRRTPPLGTLWIYSIVKLDLIPCVASLAGVGGFIWWFDLPILSTRI